MRHITERQRQKALAAVNGERHGVEWGIVVLFVGLAVLFALA